MAVKGFTFWKTYWDVAQELSATQQGALYRAICEYMFTDNDPEDDLKGSVKIAFKALKPNLVTSMKRSAAGKQPSGLNAQGAKSKANQKRIKTESNGIQDKDKGQYQDKDKDKGQDEITAAFGIPEDAKATLIDLGLLKGERHAQ